MLVLSGTVGGRFVQFPLGPGPHTVGRGSRNDINLEHNSVSRQHAELIVEKNQVKLRDLSSANGTWVNGMRLDQEVLLSHKDTVGFGAQNLTFLDSESSKGDEVSPVAVLHTTVLALSEHDKISAQESISWEEATGDLRQPDAISPIFFRAMTESGNLLVLPRPLSETFDLLLGVVERVIPARRILLLLTDTPDGTPTIRAARPEGGAGERAVLSKTIINMVLKDRQALLLNDALSDPRFKAQESIIMQNLRSAMVAPLFDNKQVIGLLYADSDDPAIHYDRNQLRAFTLLANLIAVKVTNARLLEAQREMERMDQEFDNARKVQQTLLRTTLPTLPRFEIYARQNPCYEVAGDLYDVTLLESGQVAIVVGDVTGKGMGAAMLMSNVLAGLRVLYQECPEPSVLADRLHRQVLQSSDELHFVTLFCGLLDPDSGRIDYFNAGHPPALILQKVAGECKQEELGPTGLPLGLMAGFAYKSGTATMPPDSLLCVYSDGIPEARVGDEFFGDDRFIESVMKRCDLNLDGIAEGVLEDVDEFLGDEDPDDDVTLVMLRRSR